MNRWNQPWQMPGLTYIAIYYENLKPIYMKKILSILLAGLLISNYVLSQGETLQSVTDRGFATTNIIRSQRPASKIDNSGVNEFTGMEFNSALWAPGAQNYLCLKNPDANTFRFATDYDGHGSGGSHSNIQFGTIFNCYLHIANTGNIGIATTSPAYTLDVNGTGNFNGYVKIQSTAGSNPLIGSRNPLYLDALNYGSSNSSAIVFSKGNNSIGEIASDLFANGGKDLYMIAGGSAANILLNPFEGVGNVGIGTNNPQSKLAVKGTITSMKVKVTQDNWADYVFDSSYQLTPLHQVEKYIQQHKHLPEVPSGNQVKKEGLDLGDNQAVLLKKIEELTLYIIEQNKRMENLEQTVRSLQQKDK